MKFRAAEDGHRTRGGFSYKQLWKAKDASCLTKNSMN